MAEQLEALMGVALAVFMAGSLFEMGLRVRLDLARAALQDVRFVSVSLLWAFVVCPGIALVLATIIPMEQPYAVGLLLLGMAPCAPFLPVVAVRARGDLSYVAAFMVIASIGTVAYMPLAVPVLIEGLAADASSIARPLVLFIALPLVIGAVVHVGAPALAVRLQGIAKHVTAAAALVLIALVIVLYTDDFIGAIGTYAIAAQLLFLAATAAGAYAMGASLPEQQRSVLALGLCTRNVGAALAPLVASGDADRRAITMVALAVPTTALSSVLASRWMARRVPKKIHLREEHP